MINLLCTVRECKKNLQKLDKTLVCPSGHSFDISRSGYVNLLQPQDRRSLNPGDSKSTVDARHRLLINGQDSPVIESLLETIKNFALPNKPKILDVGCGEGFYLSLVLKNILADVSGLDISVAAIELAARNNKNVNWIVANADRFLPYPKGEFDVVMSITARKNPDEFSRIISPQGYLLIVVPGADDLIELRESIMETGVLRDRTENTLELFAGNFSFLYSKNVKYEQLLSKNLLKDLLLTTYRGARRREQERFEQTSEMRITFSRQIFCFRPK